MWLWIAANIISELLNAEIKREHMLEEFNFHWSFPHELEAELIDSIQSNKPPFLLVPTFLAGRVVAGVEDVRRCGPKPKQRGCVNLVERVEERKNELAFFTRVGGRKVVLLNTVQLLSREQNVYDRLWNFLWIWLIAWANITFQWQERQYVVSWQRIARKGSEGAVSQMFILLLGYLIYLWLQKQCAKRAAVGASACHSAMRPTCMR